MKMKQAFKLSALSAALLVGSSTAIAGQIVGGPQGVPSPETQGFGAWNLDNVSVQIINVEDGSDTGKVYSEADGSYDVMTYGDTFQSPVYDSVGEAVGDVTGVLHGKDWPVGEPSGLKVVNDADINATLSHSRPASCLMSTSYFLYSELPDTDPDHALEGGWLDSQDLYGTAPNPTVCGSPFQTHKRFKVDAVTPTAADTAADASAPAKPIDLVINVDPLSGETAMRRYMVLQKLNNYSDRRYSGYSVEVGFGVGADFQTPTDAGVDAAANIVLSIGTGEDVDNEGNPIDIWQSDDLANFSAGLFGTADEKHPNDGFFDTNRAGYNVELEATAHKISSTTKLDSNYNTIFGNWLPSKWEPTAIFFDEDMNPLTDALLVAYWGDNPNTPEEDYTWLQGNSTGFAPATLDQLYAWSTDTGMADGTSRYSMGGVEDLLNLGMTYIVEVGDVTTYPASNFTIRMTPVVDAADDGTEPGWIANPAIAPADLIPDDYVPPVDDGGTTTTTSGGGSASFISQFGFIAMLLAFLGLGGWIVRNKMSK